MSANGVKGTLPSVEEQLRIRREMLPSIEEQLRVRKNHLRKTIVACRAKRQDRHARAIESGNCERCLVACLLNTNRYYRLHCVECTRKYRPLFRTKYRTDPRYRVRALWTIRKCTTPFDLVYKAYVSTDVCDCCGNQFKDLAVGKRTYRTHDKNLEHCHVTGEFRGWVCTRCNLAIGYADNKQLLIDVAAYLAKPRPKFEPVLELPLELFS